MATKEQPPPYPTQQGGGFVAPPQLPDTQQATYYPPPQAPGYQNYVSVSCFFGSNCYPLLRRAAEVPNLTKAWLEVTIPMPRDWPLRPVSPALARRQLDEPLSGKSTEF